MYSQSPVVTGLAARVLGGTTTATHAVIVYDEDVGVSDGEPGQVFALRHNPILALQADETVLVEEERFGELVFVPWQRMPDFSMSSRHDRHFMLDEATGEIGFGPSVRQPDGTARQYGRVPRARSRIRFGRYRHGGGVVGNVPENKVRVIRTTIPYISGVTNRRRASGGRDQESIEEARIRAQREVRAQRRAVTAEDFENLGRSASRAVARIRCNPPGAEGTSLQPGAIELVVVPAVSDALQAGDLSRLALDHALSRTIRSHLDRYRLLTTILDIHEPRYLGVQVSAEIVPHEYQQPEAVVLRAKEYLRHFISPLALDTDNEHLAELLGEDWEGWPFGRDLFVAELFSFIQQVPGVKHVLDVQISSREVIPSQEVPPDEDEEGEEGEERLVETKVLTPARDRIIRVSAGTLLCSLDHEIEVIDL
jgi:predicted phage baseplate assembly protein